MARTTFVKSARARKDGKPDRTCHTCRQPITPGQSYYWNQPSRFSSRYDWHADCLAPRGSVLESNEKRSQAMAAFEDGYDSLHSINVQAYVPEEDRDPDAQGLIDEIGSIGMAVAEGVREAAEMWRESAQAIEDGFQHETYQSQEMNDHADVYDSVADEAEQIHDQVDEYDEGQWNSFEEWAESAIEAAESALSNAEMGVD